MKTPLKDWKRFGLKVTVCGPDGAPLPEYEHPDSDPANHTYVKYIEVVPGQTFSVHLRRSVWYWTSHEVFYITADGWYAGGNSMARRKITRRGFNQATADGAVWSAYLFGEMDSPGCLPSDIGTWKDLGAISVELKKGRCEWSDEADVPVLTGPSFKGCAKAGLETYVTGEKGGGLEWGRKCLKFKRDKKAPLLTFRFEYRTAKALAELGVAGQSNKVSEMSEKYKAASAVDEKKALLCKTVSRDSASSASSASTSSTLF